MNPLVDSPVPLMHHDPDRSWITDPDPDHPKGTQPESFLPEICHGSVTYVSRTVPSRVLRILTVTDVRPSRVLPTSRNANMFVR